MLPVRKKQPSKTIPDGYELFQYNRTYDEPPKDCFHHWTDLETGKISCNFLVKKDCNKNKR